MARRIGVDIGSLVSPFRGDISGPTLAAQTYNRMADQQIAIRGDMDAKAAREAALAEQGREFDVRAGEDARQFDDALAGTNERYGAGLAQERQLAEATRQEKQRGLDAATTQEAVDAFTRGDYNALEAIRAKAGIASPGVQFTMPGEVTRPDPVTGLAPFDMVSPGLRVQRGAEELYSGDAAKVRQREQDIAGQMLMPFQSGPDAGYMGPALTAGVTSAGRGIKGVDAAKMALKEADAAALRGTSRENSRSLSIARSGAMQERSGYMAHNETQDIAQKVAVSQGIVPLNKRMDELDKFMSDINSGVPVQQNFARMAFMKELIKGAASDKDSAQFQGAAGFWNQLETNFNKYAKGGEMPANMVTQLNHAVKAMKVAAETKKIRAGMIARDSVYASTNLPWTDEQFVLNGLQADEYITGRPATPEEVQQEMARFQQIKRQRAAPYRPQGGGGASVQMRGDIVPGPMPSPMDPGGLGVVPLPGRSSTSKLRPGAPAQVQQPAVDPNAEADAILGGP